MEEHPELGYLGLNVADTPDRARGFLAEKGWDWPQLHDPDRELARSLGATYQPHVILFDAEGKVAGSFEGGGTAADWEALVAKLSSG